MVLTYKRLRATLMPSQTGKLVNSRPVDCSPSSVFSAHIFTNRVPSAFSTALIF